MKITETHCHLDYLKERPLAETLRLCQEAGVERLVTIGVDPQNIDAVIQLAETHPQVWCTQGIHPHDSKDMTDEVYGRIRSRLTHPRVVAVGEIGLDYFRLPKEATKAATHKALQKAAFARQLHMAKEASLPIVIHCRASFDDCVRMIDESGVNWNGVVFHCFTEGSVEMERLLERGGRASFTGIITYGNAEKVRQAALSQGMDRLMLETDSPYLSPEPVRGQPNEPAHLHHIAAFCAALFNTDLENLSCRTTANAKAFYGLD